MQAKKMLTMFFGTSKFVAWLKGHQPNAVKRRRRKTQKNVLNTRCCPRVDAPSRTDSENMCKRGNKRRLILCFVHFFRAYVWSVVYAYSSPFLYTGWCVLYNINAHRTRMMGAIYIKHKSILIIVWPIDRYNPFSFCSKTPVDHLYFALHFFVV